MGTVLFKQPVVKMMDCLITSPILQGCCLLQLAAASNRSGELGDGLGALFQHSPGVDIAKSTFKEETVPCHPCTDHHMTGVAYRASFRAI